MYVDLSQSQSFLIGASTAEVAPLQPGKYIVRTLGNVLYIADGATKPGVLQNSPGFMVNEYPIEVSLESGTVTIVNPSGTAQNIWFGRCKDE